MHYPTAEPPGAWGEEPPRPGQRLITMLTCAELFHTDNRRIVFGHLWTPSEPQTRGPLGWRAMTARDTLRDQITDKAVVHGKVTLSSGKEADYYVDLRRVTLDAAGRPARRDRVMLELTAGLGVRRGGRA